MFRIRRADNEARTLDSSHSGTASCRGHGRATPARAAFLHVVTTAILLVSLAACTHEPIPHPDRDYCRTVQREATATLSEALRPFSERMATHTGVFVLEDGAGSIVARAWLSEAAEKSIDVQYFIFSADNVGLIATDYILRAAERGIRVRVLVDDFLLDAEADQLLTLDSNENLSIKIYNPNINIGKSLGTKVKNIITDFTGINQRMHNKTFIVDGSAVITGGRNLADEYFDYDHEYNFRDRDVLLIGNGSEQVQESFDEFWSHPLSVSVRDVVDTTAPVDLAAMTEALHQYACNPENFWPQVRDKIHDVPRAFEAIQREGLLEWVENVRFVSDSPGKSDGGGGLGAGSATTRELVRIVRQARKEIIIQTPYLVTTEAGREVFADAVGRGVTVKILTNSLSSTDNLAAFSGYRRDRDVLLDTGIEIYEWRPDAAVRRSIMTSALMEEMNHEPVFGLHSKTMVVDGAVLVVGTFNVDPRSANLNTECIAVIPSESVSQRAMEYMERELQSENAWRVTRGWNPDAEAGLWKRFKVLWNRAVPKSVL